MSDVIEVIDMSVPQTLTIREAAQILGMGESTLHERARTVGHIVPGLPFIIIGRSRRVPRERLLAYARGQWTPEAAS